MTKNKNIKNKWDRKHVKMLILFVQKRDYLYNAQSKDYLDRIKKIHAFNELKNKLQTEMRGVTVTEIKKKWKNLRTQYVRELRFIRNSKKGGNGIKDQYVPKLWCFERLKFLEPHLFIKDGDNVKVIFIYCYFRHHVIPLEQ